MKTVLLILQIIFSSILVFLILTQSKGTGLGQSFGSFSGLYSTRRGVEKVVLYITIAVAILFFLSSIFQLLNI